MSEYDQAFLQGLSYVWGRNDQKNETAGRLAGPDTDSYRFATEWANLVREGGSRPDLGGAFEAFRDGRPIRDGRMIR
jgi:hypothetical protein